MIESTRTRGVTVRTIPVERLAALRPEYVGESVTAPYAYAYATAPDGTAYVICSEGVGWRVDDAEVAFTLTIGGAYAEVTFTNVECRTTAAFYGEEIDLADFIRTFGARLDSNHYRWTSRLTGKG